MSWIKSSISLVVGCIECITMYVSPWSQNWRVYVTVGIVRTYESDLIYPWLLIHISHDIVYNSCVFNSNLQQCLTLLTIQNFIVLQYHGNIKTMGGQEFYPSHTILFIFPWPLYFHVYYIYRQTLMRWEKYVFATLQSKMTLYQQTAS